jgi:hypothetical protein
MWIESDRAGPSDRVFTPAPMMRSRLLCNPETEPDQTH